MIDEVVAAHATAMKGEQAVVKGADEGDWMHGVLNSVGVGSSFLLDGIGPVGNSLWNEVSFTPCDFVQGANTVLKEPASGGLSDQFIFGVNVGWFEGEYGHDLGPALRSNDGPWYDPLMVSLYLRDIKNVGFQVVRFWLMEGAEGWIVDNDGILIGLHNTFLRNLDDLVRRAGNEGLLLYLCFTNQWGRANGDGIVACPSPVQNERQRTAYLEHAVRQITDRFGGNRTIWAFDAFNEIESEVREDARCPVSADMAKDFVKSTVRVIKAADPTRKVSSGSGWEGWTPIRNGYYQDLGLDFYDNHVQEDNEHLPSVSELNLDRRIFLGEISQRTEVDDEDLQRRSVLGLMQGAIDKGYKGCFVWRYGPRVNWRKGTASNWHELLREDGTRKLAVAEIKEFIERHTQRI
jgi:hypothetical protein